MRMKPAVAAITALLLATAAPAQVFAQSAKASPPASKDVKLYVFDCGVLLYNSLAAFGFDNKVKPALLTDACYLIDDPGKGTLIWDTGCVPDNLWSANGVPPKKYYAEGTKPLKTQMAESGYAPKDITYVAVSHSHWDHLGNLYQFAGSTWITSKLTRDALFAPEPPRNSETAMFTPLKDTRTIMLPTDGPYDVFGDGKAVMMPAPGHTPDSQVMVVKLAKTGPVILVGDLYHLHQDLTNNRIAAGRENADQLKASRAMVQSMAAKLHGQIWIPHDRGQFESLKKAPAFYN